MKKLIWTKHLEQRIKERKIPQQYLSGAFYQPDKVLEGKRKGTKKFIRSYGIHQAILIAVPNNQGDWVAISGWLNPPIKGSLDDRKKTWGRNYRQASLAGKIWLEIKRSVFGRY